MHTTRNALALLAMSSLLGGCSSSHPRVDASSDAGPTPSLDASRTLGPGDPSGCLDAPLLPLGARVEVAGLPEAREPPEGTCWEGLAARLYFRLEVPAHTGVQIRTQGANAPIAGLADACVSGAEDRCHHFGPTGSFSPGERERIWYFGNVEDTPRSLVLWPWFAGDPAPFAIETETFAIDEHADCRLARPLEAGELAPESALRGGSYESWHCWYLPESLFYTIEVPSMHRAVALAGSQPMRARAGCGCEASPEGIDDLLVNTGDATRRVVIEADPSQPLGVGYEPLEDNARCQGALVLPVDGPAATFEVPEPFRATFRGCGHINDPLYYRVSVPPRSTVRVTYDVNSPYPEVQVSSSCADMCEIPAVDRSAEGALVFDLTNDADVAIEHYLAAGTAGPPLGAVRGTLSAAQLR